MQIFPNPSETDRNKRNKDNCIYDNVTQSQKLVQYKTSINLSFSSCCSDFFTNRSILVVLPLLSRFVYFMHGILTDTDRGGEIKHIWYGLIMQTFTILNTNHYFSMYTPRAITYSSSRSWSNNLQLGTVYSLIKCVYEYTVVEWPHTSDE